MIKKGEGKKIIGQCIKGHFFIRLGDTCPLCNSKTLKTLPYCEGDCIACGLLYPGNAYGCCSPDPIEDIEINEALKIIFND